MTTATSLLDFYNESNRQMAEIRQAMADRVNADLKALFDFFPALNAIVIRGYTPGFNDGDPCDHSMMDPYINGRDCYGDTIEGDYEDEDEGKESAPVDGLTEEDRKTIASILNGMTDAIESQYDTNFEITVTRQDDGGVEIEKDYYDCGY